MTDTLTLPKPPVRYSNGAQWWDALGNVPLHRVVFDPLPGTATEEDVVRLDDHEDRICELVEGTLVEKTVGTRESAIAMTIGYLLTLFVRPRKLGVVLGEAGLLRILPRRVRIPDICFISSDRLPGGNAPHQAIWDLVPDLAVEVLSESNTRREMEIKLREYFTAGTRLVWYVDPETKTVDVHRSVEDVRRVGEADTLDGEPVLPGFSVSVAEIFRIP
jgi:Uma2 family endonuclease